jgi:hypothetical protein
MGFHMNEDYLDSLLKSILDMEEKEEETDPAAVEPLTEQPQDYPTNQPEELGLSGFATEYNGSRSIDQEMSGFAAENAGTRPIEQEMSGFAAENAGSRPIEQEMSGFAAENRGSSPLEQGLSDFAAEYADYQPEAELSDLGTGADRNVESYQSDAYGIENDMNRFGEVGEYTRPQTSAGDIDMSDIDELLRSISGSSFMEDEAEDTQMSEDEIENLLRQTKESAGAAVEIPGDDGGGQDWQEIQDLLTKADQNEAVDEGILSLLNSETPGAEMREQYRTQELLADDPAPSEKSSKKQKNSERKAAAQRAKEEKAAKKQELLETKKKEKEDKKAANQANKASSRKKSKADPQAAEDTQTQDGDRETDLFQMERLFGSEGSFDTDQVLSGLYGESEKPTKKKGLLAKVLDFLLEEEAVEEEPKKEKPSKTKKNKSAEKTKKDNKTEKQTGNRYENDDDDDENAVAKKKGKAKAKKPKKEKVPKAAASLDPEAKLPMKKVIAVSALCATIGAAILVCTTVLTDYSSRQSALKAYSSGNYMQCYMDLYGKKLNDQETLLFYRSECILQARLPLRRYQVLATGGENTEALDVLIQFVVRFPELQARAESWQAQLEIQAAYDEVLGYLSTAYGLSADQALTIAAEPDDLIYTQTVTRIAKGESYQAEGTEVSPEEVNPPMSDVLPEEEGLPDVEFIEGL